MVDSYIEIKSVSIVINNYNNLLKEDKNKNKELLNMIEWKQIASVWYLVNG